MRSVFQIATSPVWVQQDGVILGADTRATEGTIVADKNCSKIHYISQNIQSVQFFSVLTVRSVCFVFTPINAHPVVVVPEQPLTPNSRLISSPRTLNFTNSPREERCVNITIFAWEDTQSPSPLLAKGCYSFEDAQTVLIQVSTCVMY